MQSPIISKTSLEHTLKKAGIDSEFETTKQSQTSTEVIVCIPN